MNVDLAKPDELPPEFKSRLRGINSLCHELEYSEELVARAEVAPLVQDINEYCLSNKVVGIHYTRAFPDSILSKGLLIRSGTEIRATFIEEHGHLFTKEDIDILKARWGSYFNENQAKARDAKIYFNFTEVALTNGSAEYLLDLYGGEQIAMCFERDCIIGSKLSQIGLPLLVRCALKPGEIRCFINNPWGAILLSSYHQSLNPEAIGIDQDGCQKVPVEPEDIIDIKLMSK